MSMRRIPVDKAPLLLGRAHTEQAKNPGLRYGQCLWNLIAQDYPDVADYYCGTEMDFYYEPIDLSIDMYWTYYVEA